MGFFDDIGKKVSDVGQKTLQKTKEVSDKAINEKCPFLGEKETSKKNPINIVHVSGRKSIYFTELLQLFRDIFNRFGGGCTALRNCYVYPS
mgnify:CR=1 FL=1